MTKDKIRVGIDARFINSPGIGRYISHLLQSLPKRIQILAICTSDTRENIIDARPTADVAITTADPFGVHEQVSLPSLLYKRGVDLFHATQFTVPLMWRGPLVTTIHDCAYDRYPSEFGNQGGLARRYLRMMMRIAVIHSDRIITPSDSTKRDVQRFYGGGDQCRTVYHGVDTDGFTADADDPTVVDGEYLLYVGSTRPRKNITGLLDGFAHAVEQLESPPNLVIAGDHDDRFVNLETAITDRELQHHVIRPGYVEENELMCLYANARAFIFPSHYEGFGFPVLEAMAAATPVVTSDAASLPEVCGDAARYVNPTETRDIAAGIIDVVTDDELCERLGREGQKRADQFTWNQTAQQTTEVYDTIR